MHPCHLHAVRRAGAHAGRSAALCLLLGLCLMPGSGWARLAGDLASVQSDGLAFGASTSRSALAGATLHTQSLPNGLTVRQYVDAAGSVFAVAWEGPVLPDFERLLGAYFPVYVLIVRQQQRGIGLQTPELVIESGGMMRSFNGRAYLPNKLPAPVTEQDIH